MVSEKQFNEEQTAGLWETARSSGISRRKFLMLLGMGGAAAVLAACTKATPSVPTTAPTTAPSPTTSAATTVPSTSATGKPPATASTSTTTAAPKPTATPTVTKYGGILKIIEDKPATLFGYPLTLSGANTEYARYILEHLIRPSNTAPVAPSLATSWNITPDGKTYTFVLRKGVKFHDGTPFNAQAVSYNFTLVRNGGNALNDVESIEVLDDYTIRLSLSKPNALTLYNLMMNNQTFIVSPTALEKNGKDWMETNPVGTGPFMFKSFTKNDNVTYVRFPEYWQTGLPYLDGMKLFAVANTTTATLAFKAGDAHGLYSIDMKFALDLKKEGYQLISKPANIAGIFGATNNADVIMSNKNVRLAMEYAIDKEEICKTVGLGEYTPIYQLAPQGFPGYNPALAPRKYDVNKAKALLKEAGYANGFNVKYYTQTTNWIDGTLAVQSYLADVGIKLEIEYLTTAAYQEIRFAGGLTGTKKNGTAHLAAGLNPNPLVMFSENFAPDSTSYQNLKRPNGFSDLLAKALLTSDYNTQLTLAQELSKLLYDDQTFVPLWSGPRYVVMNQKTAHDYDWMVGGYGNYHELERAWISEK